MMRAWCVVLSALVGCGSSTGSTPAAPRAAPGPPTPPRPPASAEGESPKPAAKSSADAPPPTEAWCKEGLGSRHNNKAPCTSGRTRGNLDPDSRCDAEVVGHELLGGVGGRTRLSVVPRESGFVAVSSTRLTLDGHYPERGDDGITFTGFFTGRAPWQCFAAPRGDSSASAGVADVTALPGGGFAAVGWLRGEALSFGGAPLRSAARDANAFLVVTSAAGEERYSRVIPAEWGSDAWSVSADSDGGVVIAGGFVKDADFGAGSVAGKTFQSLYVARYDRAGKPLWVRTSPFRDSGPHAGIVARFLPQGEILVAGGYQEALDFGTEIAATPFLPVVSCPRGSRPPARATRAFFLRLTADGSLSSKSTFGDPQARFTGMRVADDGDVLLTGTFEGRIQFGAVSLVAPERAASCACRSSCDFFPRQFLVRLDPAGRARFALGFDHPILFEPGPLGTTVVSSITPTSVQPYQSYRAAAVASTVEIRDAKGRSRWSRTFTTQEIVEVRPVDRELWLVARHPPSSAATLLRYRPAFWKP
jgi:hypothetical protein